MTENTEDVNLNENANQEESAETTESTAEQELPTEAETVEAAPVESAVEKIDEQQLVEQQNGDPEEVIDVPPAEGDGEAKEETQPIEETQPKEETQSKEEKDESQTLEEGSLINATEDNELKMFVGGLSWDTEKFGLKDYFSKFGEVKDCTIKKDSKTERSRGFGFVLFATAEAVQKVLAEQNHYLDGRKIDPKKAQAQRKDGKLFVGKVDPETIDQKLKDHFSKFGEIESFERPSDKTTGKPRGFCFITFKKDGILKMACDDKNHELDGKMLDVKPAQNPDHRNRSGFMGRGGPMGRGGWGAPGGFVGGGFNYGGGAYGSGYDGFVGGYGYGGYHGGYGNFGGYGGGAYGGGGKTMKAREGSGRPRGGAWGDTQTHSNRTNWHGHRGNFHGAYQGFHDY